MNVNETFKFYGNYDVSKILEIIETNNLDWNLYTNRQKSCTDMMNTQSIRIVFDEGFGFWEANFEPVYSENYHLFEEELNNISEIIKKHTNGQGYLLKAILTKLLKKKSIPTHVDSINETFKVSRRIHIPLVTNDNCIFTVGDESINMKVGEIWEMNNDKLPHSVVNDGDEDRVHLIIDWCEKTPDYVEGFQIKVN